MIYYKTAEEIKILQEGGEILAGILDELCQMVKVNTSTLDLEKRALELMSQVGARPAFKDYAMGDGIFFPSALCVSVNNEVVHGSSLPERILRAGDIVSLDIGMEWPVQSEEEARANNRPYNKHSKFGGFFTDTCRTVAVGKISSEAKKLLRVTQEALEIGIKQALPGKTINDIGQAIERYVVKHGFSVVEDLVGHGVGYFAHEKPHVFNYEIGEDDGDNFVLRPGMVIAIEPMVNVGRFAVKMAKNKYTILTADSSLSAHFEHSIAILDQGNLVLTRKKNGRDEN